MARSTVPMKRSGRLRPVRKVLPGSDAKVKQLLTRAVSVYARMRHPDCIVCGNPSEHGAHLFHRDMPSVEFDLRNVWGCCARCNYYHEDHPQPMHDAVLMLLGEREYHDLCERANDHKFKLTSIQLTQHLSELLELIKEQKA